MEEADRLTIAAGTPGVDLMRNAGTAVAREAMRRWSARPTVVLCGPGNNGGDGFVAASVMAASGWKVRVASLAPRERLRGDAAYHAARWTGAVETLDPRVLDGAELIVDALFGSGLSRPLGADVAPTLAAAAERGLPVIAVDVPSGLKGDTGESLGARAADCTVTFARKKPGHVLLPGRDLCGDTVVADIGTPTAVLDRIAVDTWENGPALWRTQLPSVTASSNKYTRGHALLYGG
jgi:NAD(P)H-hydrate epimerase